MSRGWREEALETILVAQKLQNLEISTIQTTKSSLQGLHPNQSDLPYYYIITSSLLLNGIRQGSLDWFMIV